jgi:hypothetical protein
MSKRTNASDNGLTIRDSSCFPALRTVVDVRVLLEQVELALVDGVVLQLSLHLTIVQGPEGAVLLEPGEHSVRPGLHRHPVERRRTFDDERVRVEDVVGAIAHLLGKHRRRNAGDEAGGQGDTRQVVVGVGLQAPTKEGDPASKLVGWSEPRGFRLGPRLLDEGSVLGRFCDVGTYERARRAQSWPRVPFIRRDTNRSHSE